MFLVRGLHFEQVYIYDLRLRLRGVAGAASSSDTLGAPTKCSAFFAIKSRIIPLASNTCSQRATGSAIGRRFRRPYTRTLPSFLPMPRVSCVPSARVMVAVARFEFTLYRF